MKKYIKKGDSFVCIKTVKMKDDKRITYKKGFIYFSVIDRCITNFESDPDHIWEDGSKKTNKLFKKHFIKIKE